LAGVYSHNGPVPVAEVCAWAWEAVAAGYRIEDAADAHQATWRRCADRDVRRALGLLAQFGAVRLSGEDAAQSVELTTLGRWAMGRHLGEPEPGAPILQVRVTLMETAAPVVWRRLLVPAGIGLDRLHRVVQAAMGWQDCHMHSFSAGATTYGRPDLGLASRDERSVTVGEVATVEGGRLGYTYDFGDGWEHEIVVEAATVAEPGVRYPACAGGEGACPPEDCGGAWGYRRLREALADPSHDEHEGMLKWLGLEKATDFDPARFDPGEANRALAAAMHR
jgi:hypothetical protein